MSTLLLLRRRHGGGAIVSPSVFRSGAVISETLTRDELIDDILSGSHTLSMKGIVMVDGVDKEEVTDLSGSIRTSASALIMRTLTLDLGDPALFPKSIHSLIAPPNEVRIEVTMSNWRGSPVVETAGVFVLSEPKMTQGAAKWSLQVNCYDRSRFVQRNRWTAPTGVPDGVDIADYLRAAILSRDPFAEFGVWPTATGKATTAGVFGAATTNDPLQDLTKLATAASWRLAMDRQGRWTLYQIPDPATAPISATYSDRDPRNRFLDAVRSFSDLPGYNGVIGRSDPPAGTVAPVPIFSESWDDDPTSRTYRHGRWRPVPKFWSSPLFYDQTTLDAAVETLQREQIALTEKVTITTTADPRRVPDEVYIVDRPTLGLAGRVMSTDLTLPLDGNPMTIVALDRSLG